MKSFLLVLITIGTIGWCVGQQDGFSVLPDTIPEVEQTRPVVKEKKGSIFSGRPGRSALYSLIIPGAGQVYNKSYFRVPFVYAALGGVGYLLISNTQKYKCYRDAYIAKIDGEPLDLDAKCLNLDNGLILRAEASTLRLARDQYNKRRQTAIIGVALVWVANSIDAFVNAHLKDFDVSEDLSNRRIHIRPDIGQNGLGGTQLGIVVSF